MAIERDGNLGVVGLVTGRPSARMTQVSCHLGVISGRLAQVFGPKKSIRYPTIADHHWWRGSPRISEDEQGPDEWEMWADDPESQEAAIRDLRDRVLPAFFRRLTDEGLRDDWLKYTDNLLPPVVQQAYLGVLLKAIGPSRHLRRVEARLDELLREKGWQTPGLPLLRGGLPRSGLSLELLRNEPDPTDP